MAEEESPAQKPHPESVSASKAEQRLSSRDGRPATNQSSSSRKSRALPPSSRGKEASNGISTSRTAFTPSSSQFGTAPPENTPRDLPATNGGSTLTNTETENFTGNNHHPESNGSIVSTNDHTEESILDEDELFMSLTEEERNEWEAMITHRSKQLEENMTSHKTWSENFTKRRMFAYCRMRKLISSYANRTKFLSDLTSSLNQMSAPKRSGELKADAALISPRKQKSSKASPSSSLGTPTKSFSSSSMPPVPEDCASSPLTVTERNLTTQNLTNGAVTTSQ
ncbi:hypothetical protein ElyMa_001510300 [Elysia marginata]|uniref:Uncharacterized protein n=1 Tax=Elysia marginata TaxID=1093978 RepID=A0AAV4J7P7_9GAST|nr:hypothetical protein ElyMa_001510300 [Elysia marginata]